jgi:hypothetical protein
MSLCIDDLVPDHCRTGFGIPLETAHVTAFPGSTCYTWRCTDYALPVAAAYCREDKATGAIACATRESGGEYTCPARVDGGMIVHAYDPDGSDHSEGGFRANGVPGEPCGPSVEAPNPQPAPASPSLASPSLAPPSLAPPSLASPSLAPPAPRRHQGYHGHHPHHPRRPSPESTKPRQSPPHERGRPAPTLSCVDCRPAGEGWSCGSCE